MNIEFINKQADNDIDSKSKITGLKKLNFFRVLVVY